MVGITKSVIFFGEAQVVLGVGVGVGVLMI
jgi:hypothetical protein